MQLPQLQPTPHLQRRGQMVADLPNRSQQDIEFGVLVLSRHPCFEELSAMMTRAAVKYRSSKFILDIIEARGYTKAAEAEVDQERLPFLKECHALALEFHVRCVASYFAVQRAPGGN
jgi:hypothetical protein